MRIIEKVGAEEKGIAKVTAGSIRRSRDCDTLGGWGRTGELGDDPAVGEMVVEYDRVATAISLADTAEAGPDRGDPNWSQDRCTRRLVKDLIAFVHDLNVLSCPDNAVGIGRMAV